MAVAKLWNGSAWVRAIVGAKGDKGDPGIVIDEGSGAADGDILVYDANWDLWVPQAPAQPGKILQVVNAEKTDTQDITSLASGASAVVSGLAPSITLSSNLSKVMVLGMVTVGQNDAAFSLIVKRSGTTVGGGTVVGSRTSAHSAGNLKEDDDDGAGSLPIHFVDSPSSTSQLDYTVELLNNDSVAQAFRINKSASDTDEASIARYVSTLTLMEIAG